MKNLVQPLLVFSMLCASATGFAAQTCQQGMLPVFVCSAVPSNDYFYRHLGSDITVCQGNNKIELVSVRGDGKREVAAASLQRTSSIIVYNMLNDEDSSIIARLTINRENPSLAKFQFEGDGVFQKRVCRKTR